MSPSDTLSLITLNTWKCDGDYPRRLTLMRRELARLDPDILALQEVFVDAESQVGTAATLAVELGLEPRFAPARYRERRYQGGCGPSWSGMALLSRLRFERCTALALPTHPVDGERVAQLAVLTGWGLRLLVANVHLTYLRSEDELRCAQLANVLRHPWLGEDYDAMFLCGDFNDTPDGPLLAWLRERPGWRVIDCFEVAGAPGPRRSTVKNGRDADTSSGFNYDYVLLLERGATSRIELIAADYVLNCPDPETGLYPSDHFGVRVRFRPRRD